MDDIKIRLINGDKSKWLTLPARPEETQTILSEIGSDDGAFKISDCEVGFKGKLDEIILSADINKVNYLAARLTALSSAHVELLDAMLESPLRTEMLCSIERLIDFADNTGTYEIYRGIRTPEDLARHYIYHSGSIEMPEEWVEGIDLERFGKNLEKHESGYYTKYGYLIETGLDWKPNFENGGEVPAEYRVTPK